MLNFNSCLILKGPSDIHQIVQFFFASQRSLEMLHSTNSSSGRENDSVAASSRNHMAYLLNWLKTLAKSLLVASAHESDWAVSVPTPLGAGCAAEVHN